MEECDGYKWFILFLILLALMGCMTGVDNRQNNLLAKVEKLSEQLAQIHHDLLKITDQCNHRVIQVPGKYDKLHDEYIFTAQNKA